MEAFPFTDAEWDPLKDLANSILNAHSADDEVLSASLRLEMLNLLAGLQERHSNHPVLLKTMADYIEDAAERTPLYRRAVEIAEVHGLPTLSIRLALAQMLVHDVGNSVAALEELHACGSDEPDGCEMDRRQWALLLEDAAIGGRRRAGLNVPTGDADCHGAWPVGATPPTAPHPVPAG